VVSSRIQGQAVLPDGRTVGFRMRNVTVAFSLATATTGQLAAFAAE
jgi:hypothetical protein